MKLRTNSIIYSLMVITIFLMGVFSTSLMEVKEMLTVLIVVLILLSSMAKKNIQIDKGLLLWATIYIASNLFSMVYGRLIGNVNSFVGINVGVIEPLLFFIIIIYIEEKNFVAIENVLRFLLLVISLYNLLYFCVLNNILPGNPELFIGNYANYGGFSIGFVKFHSNNIPWLIFLIPMIVCKVLIAKETKVMDYILLALGILNSLLSLRSGFILAIAISPFIVLIFAKISKVSVNKRSVLISIVIGVVGIVAITLSSGALNNLFSGAINKVLLSMSTTVNNVDSGGYIRISQSEDLINTWLERPILGWGAAANAKHIVRSDVPGAYEMQYHAMLMQKGAVGFSIYILLIIWLFKENIRCIRNNGKYKEFTLCTLVGLASILIANATNPYLGSFDRLIMLFLPLLTIRMNKTNIEAI